MASRGNMRSRLSLVLAALLVTALAPPASADDFDPSSIVFPVIGEVTFIDDFAQPRSGGRTHGATDLIGPKMLPVVAAADGVVTWIDDECCHLKIDHGGGWWTRYIHLNNDTPGTDDGLGWGIADGIERGSTVTQGQLIGWVGDSGNAEWVTSHLHFELYQGDTPVNPYPYLLAAPRLSAPILPVWDGAFGDDDGSVHEEDIEKLVLDGVTNGCSTEPPLFCPDQPITRGQIAAFINRALDLPVAQTDWYDDDDGTFFEPDINAITEAGIGFGCGERTYCATDPLLREEMAELLVRAFGLAPSDVDWFVDDDGNRFESSIDALAASGVTLGCATEPARYCPSASVTRAQMASFFSRAMGL